MNEYKIIILRERPELAPIAAEWFHCKWGVPTEAYLECILWKSKIVTLEVKDEKDRKNCKTISKCIRCGMGR